MPDMTKTTLDALPTEILDLIITNCSSLSSLSHLARTCKRLYTYAETHGYRAFMRGNFPSYRLGCWKNAARSVTGITKSWEQRDLLARYIEPPFTGNDESGSHNLIQRHQGQSIGYPAVLACREEWTGGDWTARNETLAIGAGAELRIRTRCMGPWAQKDLKEAPKKDREKRYDQFHNRQYWRVYKDSDHKDGKCDITTVKIVPNTQLPNAQDIIYGRACGALERITVSEGFVTGKQRREARKGGIRFADLSSGKDTLLVCGQAYDLSLFRYSDNDGSPITGLRFDREGRGGMIWSGQFVDRNRIAVGRDSKVQPLAVYSVRPDGIEDNPVWKVPSMTNFTGVKTLSTIRSDHGGGRDETNLLLTGWKWGVVLLHDLRTPEHHVARFTDHIDQTCKFYSLLPFGTERFLAGTNRHGSVKVFDLRVTGARSYSSISFNTAKQEPPRRNSNNLPIFSSSDKRSGKFPGSERYDFTLFLRQSINGHFNRRRRTWVPTRDLKHSSVYSLASTSPFAPTFYVGLEGATVQIDLVSAADPFPDVAFECTRPIGPPGDMSAEAAKQWLDPWSEQITMGLIEADRPNEMFQQSALGQWSAL